MRYLKLPIPQSTPCPFWKFTKHDKIAWNALILPDPIEAIKSKMKDAGLRNKDLVGKVGSKGYISSILSGRKPLTLELANLFHRELNIPAEVLLS